MRSTSLDLDCDLASDLDLRIYGGMVRVELAYNRGAIRLALHCFELARSLATLASAAATAAASVSSGGVGESGDGGFPYYCRADARACAVLARLT
jgi:hypothetical protein